jgi:hypothetical protein
MLRVSQASADTLLNLLFVWRAGLGLPGLPTVAPFAVVLAFNFMWPNQRIRL